MSVATTLRARELGPAFDLVAEYRPPRGFFLERSGVGVCAWGALGPPLVTYGAGRIERLAELVNERLSSIRVEAGEHVPLGVGAITFDDAGPATLVVPSHVVRREAGGATWRLDAEHETSGDEAGRWTGKAIPHEPFTGMQVDAVPEPAAYERAVAAASERIRSSELEKVVLARTLEIDSGRELDPKQLLWRARSVDPDCYAFAVPGSDASVFVGASPELLAQTRGGEVRVNPLAGSAPRAGDPDEDRANAERLRASDKEREEHAIAVRDVASRLVPLCDELHVPAEPELLSTANVWHLSTPIMGRLREGVAGVLSVVAALHPTPAVGGSPLQVALDTIADLESFERAIYTGGVGWVDANGDGEWAIALRCAELRGSTARLFAGAGVVAGSEPARELDETERKFRALLDSLRWG
ncbi:MAG: isochorismate synthase [Actinomycetota bacterium]